jgi:alpha-L-fucosidase
MMLPTHRILHRLALLLAPAALLLSCSEPNGPTAPLDASPPIPFLHPAPSTAQLVWQDEEMGMFIHFGMNTFTDSELGTGKEDPALFAPETIDARQWARVAKECGFKYAILTMKHHDGFCLWPSAYTEHSVKRSPYKGGQGDVAREFVNACREEGIKPGFYLSPLDLHEPTFGHWEYNDYYVNQLTELLTGYGPIAVIWIDGAFQGDVEKKRSIHWTRLQYVARHLQPDVQTGPFGADFQWVGNEDGEGSDTSWSVSFCDSLLHGFQLTHIWFPTECDVSLRPYWFWHGNESSPAKSSERLVDIYFNSVGKNSNLLLNVPPDTKGRFVDEDVAVLREWRAKLDAIFRVNRFHGAAITASNTRRNDPGYSPAYMLDGNRRTFWATDDGITSAELVVQLSSEQDINVIKLEEAIEYGQRVSSFRIDAWIGGQWSTVFRGSTIGRTRLCTMPTFRTGRIRIAIEGAKAPPTLREIGAYVR